jgi:flagellar biosynthetic protein FliS
MSLMLMDSALQRIDQARHWMDARDSFETHHHLQRAVQIVAELRSTLNVRDGGPFAANLDDLCEYMSRQLVAANLQNRACSLHGLATLDEVADLLREIRKNAWMVQSCMTVQIQ